MSILGTIAHVAEELPWGTVLHDVDHELAKHLPKHQYPVGDEQGIGSRILIAPVLPGSRPSIQHSSVPVPLQRRPASMNRRYAMIAAGLIVAWYMFSS